MISTWLSATPPGGVLYYPCCGTDVAEPLQLFGDRISTFHFSELRVRAIPTKRIDDWRIVHHEAVDVGCRKISHGPMHNIERTRQVRVGRRHAITGQRGTRTIQIIWHEYDAVQAFEEIDSIAVFFFRGDCPHEGEGSSGVLWLREPLFGKVLDKLLDGGLIVTDGSNGYHPKTNHDHAPLWRDWNAKPMANSSPPSNFDYANRRFRCVGSVGHRYGPTYIWQVAKIAKFL